jgi:prophage maintenance system killer protein
MDKDELRDIVIQINKRITEKTGEGHAIVYSNGLDSAVGQLLQGWYSDEEAIAACFKSICLNHAFKNGNKRTAVIFMQFLKPTKLTANQLYDLTMKLSTEGGGQIENQEVANWLYGTKYEVENPKIKELSNRPIPQTGWDSATRDSIWRDLENIED